LSGGGALQRLAEATRTVPIVFVYFVDPVGSGYVQNLAHPGGNITEFTSIDADMSAKWLQMLKEIAPQITRVAVLDDAANWKSWWRDRLESAAPSFGVRLTEAGVQDVAEIERTITEFATAPNGGLLVMPSGFVIANRKPITALAERYRLPAMYPWGIFVTDGGLIAYTVDPFDLWRQGAIYVDRILRGAKPADLPVQQETKFKLVINLKTAKALGLTVSPALIAGANEVIE
jgi:putative tryptophan/tyrosine transport system substrate-binding protein